MTVVDLKREIAGLEPIAQLIGLRRCRPETMTAPIRNDEKL